MGGGGGLGGAISNIGNAGIGAATGGAWTPNGRGWTQGNDVGSSLGYSMSGGMYDKMGDQQKLQALLNSIPNISRPEYPGYQSLLNGQNQLPGQFQSQGNNQALTKLRNEAMSPGMTPWASAQMAQADTNKGNAIAQNGMLAQANMKQANRAISATTGLTGEAQKRIQAQGEKSRLLANQGIARQATQAKAGIMTQDAQQKDNTLSQLPNLELQALQPQQFNIQNTLQQKSARDLADLERYKTEMGSWATANTAKAIQNSGGGKK
jgi:hypothetical protein